MIIENGQYCIYCHTNKINGKKYIGQTKLPLEIRWGKHGEKYKGSRHFCAAIKKYGWNNFYHEVIASNLTLDEANNFERLLISKVDTTNQEKGYNISAGGNSKIPSEETKILWKKQRSGGNNWNARKVFCDGIVYGCAGDCAKAYGVLRRTLAAWLKKRVSMPQKYIDLGLRYVDEPDVIYTPPMGHAYGNNARAIPVQCEGRIFSCVSECAAYYNKKYHTMMGWITGDKRMPIEFIQKDLRLVGDTRKYIPQFGGKKPVICENKIYKMTKQCAEFYGEKPAIMSRWLSGSLKMPQKFVDMGLSYYLGGDANAVEN